MKANASPMPAVAETAASTVPPASAGPRYTEIVDMLVQAGHLKENQVAYAQRVQAKLETPRGLLDVLKELEFITDEQVKAAIRENHLSMRIGSLLVELGYISGQALENAFQIQNEDPLHSRAAVAVNRICPTRKRPPAASATRALVRNRWRVASRSKRAPFSKNPTISPRP